MPLYFVRNSQRSSEPSNFVNRVLSIMPLATLRMLAVILSLTLSEREPRNLSASSNNNMSKLLFDIPFVCFLVQRYEVLSIYATKQLIIFLAFGVFNFCPIRRLEWMAEEWLYGLLGGFV